MNGEDRKQPKAPGKDYTRWWFAPACGAETIICTSKRQFLMRKRLHLRVCGACKDAPPPKEHPTVRTLLDGDTRFDAQIRLIADHYSSQGD
jgi:hypothetical protein